MPTSFRQHGRSLIGSGRVQGLGSSVLGQHQAGISRRGKGGVSDIDSQAAADSGSLKSKLRAWLAWRVGGWQLQAGS